MHSERATESQHLWAAFCFLVKYDHEAGRLRWDVTEDARLYFGNSVLRAYRRGEVAGTVREDKGYLLTIAGVTRNALPYVWWVVCGSKRRVMTIDPYEDHFSMDNLCLVPRGARRAPSRRAAGRRVVSWCVERGMYTVVDVDEQYSRNILWYCEDENRAIELAESDEVSFI